MTKRLFFCVFIVTLAISILDIDVFACSTACINDCVTKDGRPILIRNHDVNYIPVIVKNTSGYHHVGIASGSSIVCGLNSQGLGVANTSLDSDFIMKIVEGSGGSPSVDQYLLKNCKTVLEVKARIDEDVASVRSHWGATCGTISIIDQTGSAGMFELSTTTSYYYDPVKSIRPAAILNFVARANNAFAMNDHSEPEKRKSHWSRNCKKRYNSLTNLIYQGIASSPGLTVEEVIDLARQGEPGTDTVNDVCNLNTMDSMIILGVKGDSEMEYATMLVALGNPDYSVFAPLWVSLKKDDFSSYVQTAKSGGIGYWAQKLFGLNDDKRYDQYINRIFADLEANIVKGVKAARAKWFESGDQTDFRNTIKDLHQRSAYCAFHSMKSAYATRGTGRQCNDIPVITNMKITKKGLSIRSSATATDNDGIKEYEWKFGDGSASKTNGSHTYGKAGTYLVSVIAKDSNEHQAANVRFQWITVS